LDPGSRTDCPDLLDHEIKTAIVGASGREQDEPEKELQRTDRFALHDTFLSGPRPFDGGSQLGQADQYASSST
jgi:hypothetical protein